MVFSFAGRGFVTSTYILPSQHLHIRPASFAVRLRCAPAPAMAILRTTSTPNSVTLTSNGVKLQPPSKMPNPEKYRGAVVEVRSSYESKSVWLSACGVLGSAVAACVCVAEVGACVPSH